METGTASEVEQKEPQTDEAPALQDAIKESHAAISDAVPTKRSPGRHKKDCACEFCLKKAAESKPAPQAKKTEKGVSIGIPAEYLKPVVDLPFQLAAQKTGFPGWHLSEEEKLQNAQLLEKCMARYFPQLETQHAELVGLSLGLGFAAYARFNMYSEYRLAQAQASRANATSAPPVKEKEETVLPTGQKPSLALASLLDGGQT